MTNEHDKLNKLTKADRVDKLAKLKKLLAVAADQSENNENAALAAMARAQAMAEKFGLSLDDAMQGNVSDADFTTTAVFSGFRGQSNKSELAFCPADRYLWQHLPRLYAVRIGVGLDSDGDNTVQLFGLAVDVELYLWVRKAVNLAFRTQWDVARYVLSVHEPEKLIGMHKASGLTAEEYQHVSFNRGMAARLIQRIGELIDIAERNTERDAGGVNNGTALVACKAALVEAKAKEVGFVDAVGKQGAAVYTDSDTGAMGYAAGNRVDLRKNVAQSQSALRIGKR